uniref:Reverse transcriptase domain-containing protein n=1 Tax=Hordeum vulgare subsp. vulgare TaxID=112509 RepID=A0A8I6X1B9_HORVV
MHFFYQKFWPLLSDDWTKEILAAINSGVIPEGWNSTTIFLIPKVDNPEKVAQFQSISLCNVVYKVISKMLASRLKVLLSDITSVTQSAFVPERIIMDNLIVSYECFYTMNKRKKGKLGACAVKLDMHKAYDHIEWVFVEAILSKLGFDASWIKLGMSCVTSVEYKVRFNSNETLHSTPTRGLRQGIHSSHICRGIISPS